MPLRDVVDVPRARRRRPSARGTTTWSSTSPSSSRRRSRSSGVDRVERLVRLLEQVAREGGVRLLRVPRAAAGTAQPRHDAHEVEQPLTPPPTTGPGRSGRAEQERRRRRSRARVEPVDPVDRSAVTRWSRARRGSWAGAPDRAAPRRSRRSSCPKRGFTSTLVASIRSVTHVLEHRAGLRRAQLIADVLERRRRRVARGGSRASRTASGPAPRSRPARSARARRDEVRVELRLELRLGVRAEAPAAAPPTAGRSDSRRATRPNVSGVTVGSDPLGLGLVGDEDVRHLDVVNVSRLRVVRTRSASSSRPLVDDRLLHDVHEQQARGERHDLGPGRRRRRVELARQGLRRPRAPPRAA